MEGNEHNTWLYLPDIKQPKKEKTFKEYVIKIKETNSNLPCA
jgi:hypothetical protein